MAEQLVEAHDHHDRRLRPEYGSWRLLAEQRPMGRMRRIWQAIINEATFRGYDVRTCHTISLGCRRARSAIPLGEPVA